MLKSMFTIALGIILAAILAPIIVAFVYTAFFAWIIL